MIHVKESGSRILTQYNNLFHMGFGKRVRNSKLWQNDYSTMDSGPKPKNMSMPPKCASLACKSEVVKIRLGRLNRALGYICWPISPTRSKLLNSMPVKFQFILINILKFNNKKPKNNMLKK